MGKTKEDALNIRRVIIEIGSVNGDELTIDIHPPSQTATLRSHWPSGQFRRAEHLSLESLIGQLRALMARRQEGQTDNG